MSNVLRRYPVLAGFVVMFALTWPIDLWAAAASHGWTGVPIPPILALLVGYGFVVAAVLMTGILDGWAGIRALLGRFLIWRVGLVWFAVVLLGPALVDLLALGVHVLLGGPGPDWSQSFARQLFGPSMNLWAALPVFLLVGVLTNGEEIGWRGYAQTRLQERHSALLGSVVIGIVSALWHIPKFLTAGSAQDYPFALFLLDTVAKAILLAWVYNSTRGSLLTVTLLHASLNTSTVFLPILPAATGDVRPVLISIALHCVAAVAVVLVAGPARLSRSDRPAAARPTAQPADRHSVPGGRG